MNVRIVRVCAFALCAFACTAFAHAEWSLVEERFYALTLAGKPCGRSTERVEKELDRLRTVSRIEMRFMRLGEETTIDLSSVFIESERGEPIEARVEQRGAAAMRCVFIDADHVDVFRGEGLDARKESRVLTSANWLTPREVAALVKARNAANAAEISYDTLDVQSGLVIAKIEMRLAGTETLNIAARTVELRRYAVKNSLIPVEASELYDADGLLVVSTTAIGLGDLVSTHTTRAKADESYANASFDLLAGTMVYCEAIPRFDTRNTLDITVKSTNGALMDLPNLGAQIVQRIDAASAKLNIDLTRASVALVGDETNPRWLKPNEIIDSDSIAVKELLAKAKFPKDASRLVQADTLRALVARHLSNKNLATAFGSASLAAQSRSGDCTEHAVLLAALLRAHGIPSRVASGLVYVENLPPNASKRSCGWGWHLWTQALVEPPSIASGDELAWVDFDATLAPRGERFHAGHLLVAISDLAGGATDPAFAQAVSLIGSIEIVAHSNVPQKPTTKAISK